MVLARQASRIDSDLQSPVGSRRAYSLAVLTQGANPKSLVFFTAILPQFINPMVPVARQLLILGVSSVVIEFLVLAIYIGTCHAAREWTRQPRVAGVVQRLSGAFLIGAGVRLGLVKGS